MARMAHGNFTVGRGVNNNISRVSKEMNQVTARDVVNGKGQGALRMAGNVIFRRAIDAHKVGVTFFFLLFNCPRLSSD